MATVHAPEPHVEEPTPPPQPPEPSFPPMDLSPEHPPVEKKPEPALDPLDALEQEMARLLNRPTPGGH